MQVTEIINAKTFWFASMSVLDNEGGTAIGPIHRGLIERYKFMNHPVSGPDILSGSGGLIYKAGEFSFSGRLIGINLSLFSDGLVAETSVSTDASDAFLEDLSDWVVSTFRFKRPSSVRTRIVYESQLYLTSNVSLIAGDQLRTFTTLLREYTGNATEEPWAFLFEPDGQLTSFSFERRANTPFSTNQYYSKSAVSTSKHIELLQAFEKIFQ